LKIENVKGGGGANSNKDAIFSKTEKNYKNKN
jgi:hypothetical protein